MTAVSSYLIECTKCLAHFEMDGATGLREVSGKAAKNRPIRREGYVCGRCREASPLDDTRARSIDGYMSSHSSRDIDGMGRKR